MERHYGLDWLRIGAFAILILYHVGMVFVPWGFHAKLAREDWVAIPMMASNPWRLALLFVVSGYASRALLMRSAGPGAFARSRCARLLVPLAFAMVVVIPSQPWIELVTQHGYAGSLARFWTGDYFRFGTLAGIMLPTWQHLWFVVYLWIYSMLLAGAAAIVPAAAAQRGFEAVTAGPWLFVLPGAWLIAVSAWWFPGARETHMLIDDFVAHATYLPAFLFGVALAGRPRALAAFARWWGPALAVAIVAYGVVSGIEWRGPGKPWPWGHAFSVARAIQGWAAIAALIGIAERFWNRDHPWRSTLTEAVFPFYIIHQTTIVVVAYWLMGAGLPMAVEFAILVAATAGSCWLFYAAGRSVSWLRPLIGLRARAGA